MESVVRVDAAAWAHLRFVRSRLWEVEHAVRTLVWPDLRLHHRAWLESVDVAAATARLPILRALNPRRGSTPDFLTPPGGATAEDELDALVDTDLDVVVAETRQSLDSAPSAARRAVLDPLVAEPARLLDLAAEEMRWAWDVLLAPFWGPVSRLVDADVAYRGRAVARHGAAGMVAAIDPRIRVEDDAIVVTRGSGETYVPGPAGIALMPSAFVWPSVVLITTAPWPVTVVYPARGIAELWERPPAPAEALVGVLGRTRALLLADLGVAATTTALAARHDLSPAAVSTQLGRLRAAGLVRADRQGKEVLYRRTALADRLLAGTRG